MTLFWALNYDSSNVRYSIPAKKFRKWILDDKRTSWAKLARYLPEDRDFAVMVKNLRTPILISNSWQDKFFNANGTITACASISAPYRIYLGAVRGHGSDTTFNENLFHSSILEEWIEYWLYGIDNGINGIKSFNYASSTEPVNYNHWSFKRSNSEIWPPAGTVKIRFYFHPNKRLGTEPNRNSPDTVSLLNDVRGSLKMLDVIKKRFQGAEFDSKFVKTYIYFESDVLKEDLIMAGSPAVNLSYSSSTAICQFNFQIWEVKPDEQMNFVSRINFTDRYYYPGTNKQKYFYGQAHSHIFRKGHRIRIYITNLDNGPYDSFLGTNPFVLPVLKRAKNIVYMNPEKPTFIDLPVIRQ
jgi:predicted acyl esterase